MAFRPAHLLALPLAALTTAALALTASLAPAASAAVAVMDPTDPSVTAAVKELSDAPTVEDAVAWDSARAELAESGDSDFYAAPPAIPATPGAVIRQEPMDFYLDPVKLVRVPATATRIMYSSQNREGLPIAVTGTVLAPSTPWGGKTERPLVVFAPGTQGLGDRCAPSRTLSTGLQYESVGITALLTAGYTVVVPDYEGLGTAGVHTYMDRISQGHTVLDAARAAQSVSRADVSDTSPVGLAGYSQGGMATASAAELAPHYAPELPMTGAYVGAPPADLQQLAETLDHGPYAGFGLFVVTGLGASYRLDPPAYLNARGRQLIREAADSCYYNAVSFAFLDSSTATTEGQTFPQLFSTDPTWRRIISEQTVGTKGRAPDVPVLITHSLTDDIVPFRSGRDLGRRWCDADAHVRFDPLLTPTHVGGYVAGLPRMLHFLDTTFRGRTTVNSCGWF